MSESRNAPADAASTRGRVLLAKPGLDGHDRGIKFIARCLRDAGFEVIYTGIRRTPLEIAVTAVQEDVDVIGLSLLSGAHQDLFPAVIDALRKSACQVPVIGGGVIPEEDVAFLKEQGIAEVFTSGASVDSIVKAFQSAVDRSRATKPR